MAESKALVSGSTSPTGNVTVYTQDAKSWALRFMSTADDFSYQVRVTLMAGSPVALGYQIAADSTGDGGGPQTVLINSKAASGAEPVYAIYAAWSAMGSGAMSITYNASDTT